MLLLRQIRGTYLTPGRIASDQIEFMPNSNSGAPDFRPSVTKCSGSGLCVRCVRAGVFLQRSSRTASRKGRGSSAQADGGGVMGHLDS